MNDKKNIIKKILMGLVIASSIIFVAFTSKQIMGPTSATTANAVVRWKGTTGWQATNSVVIIDDSGNVTGIATMSINQANINTIYVTNGFVYLQKTSPPLASDIGGTVGSVTNHEVININGILYDYWSDGTTLYGPKQLSP